MFRCLCLGKANQGRVEPVNVEERVERSGLGSQMTKFHATHHQKRLESIRKTQERYTYAETRQSEVDENFQS